MTDRGLASWNFDPWVGSQYDSGGYHGLKVLFLGEAQYSTTGTYELIPECRNSTCEYVTRLAIHRTPPVSFYTKVTRLLNAGCSLPGRLEDRKSLWDQVAFYNYLQQWTPSGRTVPDKSIWDAAASPFIEIVQSIRPDLIVAISLRMATRLPVFESRPPVCAIPHVSARGFTYMPAWESVANAIGSSRILKGLGA
jgi:hypothetical protein